MFAGKIKIGTKVLALVIALALFLLPISAIEPVKATSVTDLQNQKNALNQQIQTTRTAQEYQRQQAAYVTLQLQKTNTEISDSQKTINETQGRLDSTQAQVDSLKTQISAQEDQITKEKSSLSELISDWYMEGDDQGLAMQIIANNNLSDVVTSNQYYDSIKDQISTSIDKVKALKTQLELDKAAQDKQLAALSNLQSTQLSQKKSLQNTQWTQYRLLNDTNSMVAELQSQQDTETAQAAKLDQQIQAAYKAAGGGGKITGPNIHGPANMKLTYYSQNDPRWASQTLGSGGLPIDDDGCLMTSLAMVATSFGLNYDPGSLTDDSMFSNSYFQGFASNIPGLVNYEWGESVDYGKIDSELQKGYPVIVGINLSSTTHWIVLTGGSQGNYSWYDPYTKWSTPLNYNNYHFFSMRTFD
jgi:peptidoglycan hydrolase CwlO-like protein